MHRRFLPPACFALAAAALAAWSAAPRAQIRVSTQTVPLYVTVTDRDGRLVPGLVRDDFEVYDNGKLQPITNFYNEPQPITVVVMLDTSGSMTLSLDLVKLAAEEFLIRLLPDDRGKVGAFNDKLEVHPGPGAPFSADRDQLIRSLKELDFGYPTRLWDAVDYSIDQLEPVTGRKVVLVFTDGDDTSSKLKLGDVLERARALEVMVYAVGMETEFFDGVRRQRTSPDRGLRRLTEETGGGFFVLRPNEQDQLGSTFTRVANELHAQYVLGFTPENLDGKVHRLEVKLKKPGMTARARRSYLATPAGTGTGDR